MTAKLCSYYRNVPATLFEIDYYDQGLTGGPGIYLPPLPKLRHNATEDCALQNLDDKTQCQHNSGIDMALHIHQVKMIRNRATCISRSLYRGDLVSSCLHKG
jgi:hypothetical protein